MPRILFVKSDKKHKRVEIGISDDERGVLCLCVKESTYSSLSSAEVGEEVDSSQLAELIAEDEIFRCFNRILRIIASSDKSRYELKCKLVQLGYSRASLDEALDLCEEYGYLDEPRQLERLIEREANQKLRGRYYIRRKLLAKGYQRQIVDRVTDELVDKGEIDFDANLELLAQKKFVTDEDGISVLKYKYGYKI